MELLIGCKPAITISLYFTDFVTNQMRAANTFLVIGQLFSIQCILLTVGCAAADGYT